VLAPLGGGPVTRDLLSDRTPLSSSRVQLEPFQVAWLTGDDPGEAPNG
jgi:hypothetical protein